MNESSKTSGASLFSTPSSYLRWNFKNPGIDSVSSHLRSYYRSYYDSSDNINYVWKYFDRRGDVLGTAAANGARILDVGCGLGTYTLWACLCGASCIGLDVQVDYIRTAEDRRQQLESLIGRSLDCKFISKNLFEFEDTNGFDVVFLHEAFHHLEPRERAVEILTGFIRSGGKLLIQESNAWNPLLQVKLLRHRGTRTIKRVPGKIPGESYLYGNERILTPRWLSHLFEPLGFFSSIRYFRLLPTSLAHWEWLASFATKIEDKLGGSFFLKPWFLFYEWIGEKHK